MKREIINYAFLVAFSSISLANAEKLRVYLDNRDFDPKDDSFKKINTHNKDILKKDNVSLFMEIPMKKQKVTFQIPWK